MANSFHKVNMALSLLSRGHVGALIQEVKKEVASEETGYAFRRDLQVAFRQPAASIPVTLRPFRADDRTRLLGFQDIPARATRAVLDRVTRIELIEAHMPSCYVGVTEDGSPCFIQWLISAEANHKLQAYYGGYFLPLASDEVLLEGAFVPEGYRGKGIMACAMSLVAERGRDVGARWAITYVEASNLPSLRGCLASGFHPFLLRKVAWRAFTREASFTLLGKEECERLEASWQESGSTRHRSSSPGYPGHPDPAIPLDGPVFS